MKPPYPAIAKLLGDGQVVPFLGAAANFGAGPDGARFDPLDPVVLPGGQELSRHLADFSGFEGTDAERNDLPRVSAYAAEAVGRGRLREMLHELFDRPYEVAPVHRLLARVARKTHLLIVTTNYDGLMEQALDEEDVPHDVVYYPTDRPDLAASVFWWPHGDREPTPKAPNGLPINLSRRTVVFKMHGTVVTERRMPGTDPDERLAWDSYVITEDDYVEFLARMADQKAIPQKVFSHFRGRHFLFMGYGLGDWNLRVLMRSLQNVLTAKDPAPDDDSREPNEDDARAEARAQELLARSQEVRSWAIQFRPSDEAQFLWRNRQVNIYNVDIKAFSRELANVMKIDLDPRPVGAAAPPA